MVANPNACVTAEVPFTPAFALCERVDRVSSLRDRAQSISALCDSVVDKIRGCEPCVTGAPECTTPAPCFLLGRLDIDCDDIEHCLGAIEKQLRRL
jgi:hypothetical protein